MMQIRTRFSWDDFVLDLDTFRLERGGHPVALEPKALDVLALLVGHPHHLFTKQEIFEAVWADTAVTDHALTRVIAQIRRALGDDSRESRYIETVPTRGYRWVRPLTPNLPGPDAPGSVPGSALPSPAAAPPPHAEPATSSPASGSSLSVWWFRAVALAFAGIGAASMAVWVLGPRIAPPLQSTAAAVGTSVPWPVQVTTHDGLDLHPAVSPRGDALAFASDRSGTIEIYVRALADGAVERPLTSDGGFNVQPAWSPDGSLLAYHSYQRGGIWVVPARGGTPRQVVPEGSNPSWSPDGRRLAFQSDEHADVTPSAFGAQAGSTLWVVDVDGRNPQPLTRVGQPQGGHASPVWSPDGRYIGFSVFESTAHAGVWLLTVDTGATRPVRIGSKLYELAFAPDGTAIYAAGGEALIVRLPFDAARGEVTGPPEFVAVAGVPGVRGISVAPDGRRLWFAGLSLRSQVWAQPIDAAGASAGEARPLTTDTSRRNFLAAVSRDGTTVAYTSTRRGEPPSIWMIGADGSDRVQVTGDEFTEGAPMWLAEGRRIAFFGQRGETVGLWSVDVDTRRESLLFALPAADYRRLGQARPIEMKPSPSLRQLAYVVLGDGGGRQVWSTPLGSFDPHPVSDPSQWVGYPAWSPDERHLAVEIKEGSSTHAGVIDVATGTLRQLTHDRGQTWVHSWSPDGRRIAVAVLRDGTWGLRAVDTVTGEVAVMLPQGAANVYVRYPDWSPAGGLVAYERGELEGNIWSLPLR